MQTTTRLNIRLLASSLTYMGTGYMLLPQGWCHHYKIPDYKFLSGMWLSIIFHSITAKDSACAAHPTNIQSQWEMQQFGYNHTK
jgi:hypothetical protein